MNHETIYFKATFRDIIKSKKRDILIRSGVQILWV